jgi:anaerobic magnesium-protoporphyrin IX monomethyl ester cyclase
LKGKVLFIVHDVYQKDNYFPSGIGYLAACLKANGCEVSVYCQDIFHYTNEQLAEYLKRENFDIIGLGFLAARFKETVIDLCKVINTYKKDAWLVLGGHGPSAIPEYILKTTNADIVVIGEGEETIIDLINYKINNRDITKVLGIAYNLNGEVRINERRKPIQKLDNIPFPEWSIFPMNEYTSCLKFYGMNSEEKSLPIITSRGCTNRCNFCYRLEKGIRFRSIPNIIDEIRVLNEKYGVTFFAMNDELFLFSKKRLFEFKDALEQNNLKIKYECQARVDIFNDEIAQCLKDSGCTFVNFGMESADQKVLDLMNKHTTVKQNTDAAKIARKHNIAYGLNILWGNIGDTEQSLKDDVQLIKEYNVYSQLRTIKPPTPYPGCDLYYVAINRHLLEGPDDFFSKFKNIDLLLVNFTDIPKEKFYTLLFEANKELILDHYEKTSGDKKEAEQYIQTFYNLYFKGDVSFRGARHYDKKN